MYRFTGDPVCTSPGSAQLSLKSNVSVSRARARRPRSGGEGRRWLACVADAAFSVVAARDRATRGGRAHRRRRGAQRSIACALGPSERSRLSRVEREIEGDGHHCRLLRGGRGGGRGGGGRAQLVDGPRRLGPLARLRLRRERRRRKRAVATGRAVHPRRGHHDCDGHPRPSATCGRRAAVRERPPQGRGRWGWAIQACGARTPARTLALPTLLIW